MSATRLARLAAEVAALCTCLGVDHWASAYYFDGFANVGPPPEEPPPAPGERVVDGPVTPVTRPRSWLLREGWRRHGLIHTGEYSQGERKPSG